MCYNVVARGSLDNVENFWSPETRREIPKVPIILAGNKLDLKSKHLKTYVREEEGEETRLKINAQAHVQCSAKQEILNETNDQLVDKIFKFAIKFGLEIGRKRRALCHCTVL